MASPRGDEYNVLGPGLLVRDRTNKVGRGNGTGNDEGIAGEEENALDLKLSDNELLELSRKWEDEYKGYSGKVEQRQKTNKLYYKGTQNQVQQAAISGNPVAANRIFSATETFLAAALAKEPEPVVYADNTPQGNEEARLVKTILQTLADQLVIRKKLALMVRHWNIYFIGVLKHGWDDELQEICTEVRNPRNFIFDPNGYVDEYGDFCGYVGEKITTTAEKVAELFEDHKQFIGEIVEFKWGTSITYTEWWQDDYCFYTFKGRVLDKSRNPHFNYPKNTPEKKGDLIEKVLKKGNNHFAKPKKPYTFLSVFSLQEAPHDETSLIEQNIPNQNILTERVIQIAKNFKSANNSLVFSADKMDAQKATQSARGMEEGRPVLVNGDVREAVARFPAPSFPPEAFKEIADTERRIDETYGVQGLSAVAQNEETTARGMILNQQRDSTRIGGGIGDSLQQVASNVFNQWYQFIKVYYDEPHMASYLGASQSVELAVLDMDSIKRRITITTAPDSMVPKDELTQANQAMQLAEAGMLDPKALLRLQNIPGGDETAENAVLWMTNKQAYIQKNFPELAQFLGMQSQQAVEGGQQQGQPQVSPIQPQAAAAPAEQPAPLEAAGPLPSLPR